MAVLTEAPVYVAGIYQLETTDPVLGGVSGVSNLQAKQLANRTAWLKQRLDLSGLSGEAAIFSGNLNTLTAGGFYWVESSSTNRPGTEQTGFAIVIGKGNAPRTVVQLFMGYDVWQRQNIIDTVSTYGPWVRLQRDAGLVGSVAAFAMNTPPTGWLKANGAIINRNTYINLFLAIGETYGAGDGSTTFQLPDLRGEFIRGWDDGRGIDTGRAIGTAQDDQFRTHKHQLAPAFVSGGANVGYSDFGAIVTGGSGPVAAGNVQDFGGPETRPRNISMLYCIRYA